MKNPQPESNARSLTGHYGATPNSFTGHAQIINNTFFCHGNI
jgi:hypothetical protein